MCACACVSVRVRERQREKQGGRDRRKSPGPNPGQNQKPEGRARLTGPRAFPELTCGGAGSPQGHGTPAGGQSPRVKAPGQLIHLL